MAIYSQRTRLPNRRSSPANEHPIEVIGRVREHPDKEKGAKQRETASPFQVLPAANTIRVKSEFSYKDFTMDGVSLAENEDLSSFYERFIQERVFKVRTGKKCTVLMYGPTGSGKSHTMFGCPSQSGIIYRALHDIIGDTLPLEVKVSVIEIYNEDVYDLLNREGATHHGHGFKNGGVRVKLQVMDKKVKNALFISGNESAKIAREVAKVERRRIVKSTLLNERSSRSHCIITVDVPSVGGRLMLVDMAGSETIHQSGTRGTQEKMQTAKINQGNVALKRVVEAVANGDSHIPFRDSKLTMILQDSFQEDKGKMLMILCASPAAKDIHKTIATLEYGAKAKSIVRGTGTRSLERPVHEFGTLQGRFEAKERYILELEADKLEKERQLQEVQKTLVETEHELAMLKAKVHWMQERQWLTEVEVERIIAERVRASFPEMIELFEECSNFIEMTRKECLQKTESQIHNLKGNPNEVPQGLEAKDDTVTTLKKDGSGIG